ncbi:IS66-like element accessory protein TnpA [Burkholderia gladioli]|uniref:IS66-like element accessory protein TnpA n=1 Tax=Burkholderia gladioli TaxID=28095 RepID=UPI001C26848D|nr:transposase [Burkholderia gladioli]
MTQTERKAGTRQGSPNYDPEFKLRLTLEACEPGASVSKLARENGVNANMLFNWRRRYLAAQAKATTELIPVTVVTEVPHAVVPEVLITSEVAMPPKLAGTIEVRIGRAVIKVDGVVDAEMLRAVLGSLKS